MKNQKRLIQLFLILFLALTAFRSSQAPPRILVFSKTDKFYHRVIPTAQDAFLELGAQLDAAVDTTTNANVFTNASLRNYKAVVFLHTTGDVLNDDQQGAFEEYIRAGGAYFGLHSAADTEYEWPWYGRLVGGYFNGHPAVQRARLLVTDRTHASTDHLPETWERSDEWYNFRYTNPDVTVVIKIDESSYDPGDSDPAPNEHPMAWYHEFEGGRSFYTALGHVAESYTDPLFLEHVKGGLEYVLGD